VNVTFTPACQFALVKSMVPGLEVIAVLPVRVSVTVTVPVGAAASLTFDVPVVVPLALPVMLTVAGFTWMVPPIGVVITENGIEAVEVDSGGFALSKAVACAVWLPTASVEVLKL
jgi:hypothetical protein